MRTADDNWDITTSVGATALAVAAARAVETGRDSSERLVDDPYAVAFIQAAAPRWPLPDRPDTDDEFWAFQSTYLGVRSKFFDDALSSAVSSGVTQVVLLAAGLDVRAYRLGWPSDVTTFEVDQPAVLEFKDRVLDEQGASPDTKRVTVPVDLRHDWPSALRDAGFDPSRPTAWLAEGLLPYLPADAEKLLFERVQELSAPGSRIAVEHFAGIVDKIASNPGIEEMSTRFIGTDIRELFFDETRESSPDRWLPAHGWTASSRKVIDQTRLYGRTLGEHALVEVMGQIELLEADLGTS